MHTDLRAHLQGRDVLPTSNDDNTDALRKVCDQECDTMYVAQAGQVLHSEMFERKYLVDGSFKEG